MAAIPPMGRSHVIQPTNQELADRLKEAKQKQARRNDFFRALGLPITGDGFFLYAEGVYDILHDKDKLRELITKLNNKAFW